MVPNALPTLALLAALAAAGAAAQTPPADSPPVQRSPGDRVERITHEDALTRIDELRVDGQTQSIQVQPKNGAPAYQIQPLAPGQSAGEGAGRPAGNAGRSSWRVLNF
jgi:nitrous oxidase accessory protein NosD